MKKTALLLLLFTGWCSAQQFVNPSFEDWNIPCSFDQAPTGWFNYSSWGVGLEKYELGVCQYAVIAASDGVFYGNAISGSTSAGEGVGQNVSGFTVGNTYELSFDYTGGYYVDSPFSEEARWHVYIANFEVDATPVFTDYDHVWHTHTVTFTATAPLITIGFRVISDHQDFAGVGVIDNFKLTPLLSTDNFATNTLNLSSNPMTDSAQLKTMVSLTNGTLAFYNVYGQLLKKMEHLTGNENQIERGNLAAGVYLLQLSDNNRLVGTQKLIVQ